MFFSFPTWKRRDYLFYRLRDTKSRIAQIQVWAVNYPLLFLCCFSCIKKVLTENMLLFFLVTISCTSRLGEKEGYRKCCIWSCLRKVTIYLIIWKDNYNVFRKRRQVVETLEEWGSQVALQCLCRDHRDTNLLMHIIEKINNFNSGITTTAPPPPQQQ